MALIIANMLIAIVKPKNSSEKGFANPTNYLAEEPEIIIEHLSGLKENTAILSGAINATNKKIELLNDRLNTIENVVMTLTQQKLSEKNEEK